MNKIDDILEQLKGQQPVIDDPDALTDRIMDSLENLPQIQTKARPVHLWRWVTAAACILLLIGIGLHYQFEGASHPIAQSDTLNQSIGHVQSVNRARSISQSSTLNQSIEHAQLFNRARSVAQSSTLNQSIDHAQLTNRPRSVDQSTTLDSDPDLHYTAAELTKDTVPYQDPARVDSFIQKLAAYNNVKEGELACSATSDDKSVSSVYVFPDTKEIDVFSRLLQVACCYKNETPGYFLNFSHQQFFFELKDMRRGLQYRWIAERINGRILLYGTHVPLGTKESSACFQEYRDELMHINSINHKTKEI
jgi:hypothetical protein